MPAWVCLLPCIHECEKVLKGGQGRSIPPLLWNRILLAPTDGQWWQLWFHQWELLCRTWNFNFLVGSCRELSLFRANELMIFPRKVKRKQNETKRKPDTSTDLYAFLKNENAGAHSKCPLYTQLQSCSLHTGSPGMGGQTQTILRSHRTQPYTSMLSDFFLLSLTQYDSLKFVCCFFFCFFFLFKLLVCMRLLLDKCSSWVRDALKLFMLLDPVQYFHFKDQKTEVERRWTLSKLIQLGRVQTQTLQLQSTPVIREREVVIGLISLECSFWHFECKWWICLLLTLKREFNNNKKKKMERKARHVLSVFSMSVCSLCSEARSHYGSH